MIQLLTNMRRLVMVGAVSLCGLAATAVPAKPGLIQLKQSDGSTISVRLYGDERSHFYTSADNHLLVRDTDGLFRYAVSDGLGGIKASEIKAVDVNKRSASQNEFLSKLDKDALIRAWHDNDAKVAHKIKRSHQNRVSQGYPTTGEQKGLVILVEYSDVKFKSPTAIDDFKRMLNEEGYSENGGTGSAYDFFYESSNGQFKPQFDVYGPVTLDKPMKYYGGNNSRGDDEHAHDMVIEACRALESEVDFSQYDCDHNGVVDNVFIFYAGYGEATCGDPNTVWPHQWELDFAVPAPVMIDGLKVNNYACTNERDTDDVMVGIGTFVHEFSHVLGLPDLYATNYSSSFTPGMWSVLDEGPYNNNGRTPPVYSAYERYYVGWLNPREIGAPESVTLKDISSNEALIIRTDRTDEFFILENRQQKGWDTYLPGHGMLIWHIDYDSYIWEKNTVNNTSSHQRVDIEEADNLRSDGTLDGDAFPGAAGITSFTDDTAPSMRTWNNTPVNKPITNIQEVNGIITFDISGGHAIIEAPVVAEATDVNPISFVAHWNKVDKATGYLLSVYTKETVDGNKTNAYVEGFNARPVGNVLECKVENLLPETQYFYTVNSVDDAFNETSASSEEMSVTTPVATFDFVKPNTLPAEDVTENSFIAKWEALEGAVSYNVEVYRKQFGAPEIIACDFTNGMSDLPEGWLTNCKSTYSAESYSGKAVPAARMSAHDAYIETPVLKEDIRTFSFWHRGANADAENCIIVEALISGTWTELERVAVVNAAGGAVTTWCEGDRELPFDVRAIRIRYNMAGKGSIAVDDIEIGHGGEVTKLYVDGMNPKNTTETQLLVEGVVANETYYYVVTGVNDSLKSMPSKEIRVQTLNSSGIENVTIEADDIVDVYNMQGIQVLSRVKSSEVAGVLPAGLYIMRGANATLKITVR